MQPCKIARLTPGIRRAWEHRKTERRRFQRIADGRRDIYNALLDEAKAFVDCMNRMKFYPDQDPDDLNEAKALARKITKRKKLLTAPAKGANLSTL